MTNYFIISFDIFVRHLNLLTDFLLNLEVRNAKSIHIFKQMINWLSFFSTYDPLGIKLLTRLRLKFRHVNEHKFKYNFVETVLCVDVMVRLKILNTSSSVAIFFLLKDSNSSIILTKLTWPNKSNTLNQDIIKFVINFLKGTLMQIRKYPYMI